MGEHSHKLLSPGHRGIILLLSHADALQCLIKCVLQSAELTVIMGVVYAQCTHRGV